MRSTRLRVSGLIAFMVSLGLIIIGGSTTSATAANTVVAPATDGTQTVTIDGTRGQNQQCATFEPGKTYPVEATGVIVTKVKDGKDTKINVFSLFRKKGNDIAPREQLKIVLHATDGNSTEFNPLAFDSDPVPLGAGSGPFDFGFKPIIGDTESGKPVTACFGLKDVQGDNNSGAISLVFGVPVDNTTR